MFYWHVISSHVLKENVKIMLKNMISLLETWHLRKQEMIQAV